MKKSMVDYISSLAKKNYKVLEKIICKKYEKFTELYWILKEHSDYIEELDYTNDEDDDKLTIDVKVSKKKNVEEILDSLKKCVPNSGSDITICKQDKNIHIEIVRHEKFKNK